MECRRESERNCDFIVEWEERCDGGFAMTRNEVPGYFIELHLVYRGCPSDVRFTSLFAQQKTRFANSTFTTIHVTAFIAPAHDPNLPFFLRFTQRTRGTLRITSPRYIFVRAHLQEPQHANSPKVAQIVRQLRGRYELQMNALLIWGDRCAKNPFFTSTCIVLSVLFYLCNPNE